MFGILAGILGAIAGIGSTIINANAQKSINQQNAQIAQNENDIMRSREDNAVQRRAEDLKQAGINPLLAGLGGASANSGQIIPMQAPQMQFPDFGELFRDIKEGQNFDAQNKKIKSETSLNKQQVKNLRESVEQIRATTTNIKNDTLLKLANTKLAEKDVMLKKAQIELSEFQKLETKAQTALAYQNAKAVRDRVAIEARESSSRIRLNATQQKALFETMKEVQEKTKTQKQFTRLTKKQADYFVEQWKHKQANENINTGVNAIGGVLKSVLMGF